MLSSSGEIKVRKWAAVCGISPGKQSLWVAVARCPHATRTGGRHKYDSYGRLILGFQRVKQGVSLFVTRKQEVRMKYFSPSRRSSATSVPLHGNTLAGYPETHGGVKVTTGCHHTYTERTQVRNYHFIGFLKPYLLTAPQSGSPFSDCWSLLLSLCLPEVN